MPTYDYECRSCGERFTRTERIADHGTVPVACPKCGAATVERVLAPAYPRTARKS